VDVRALAINNTVDMLRQFSCVHPKVIKIVKMHGERLNGSGFPKQLQGDQIFLLSKIASIASYYDRVTYKADAKCATPASQSFSRLYSVRGVQFQDELVVEFIQAIGLYPTGTLVKLTNQEVAVVAEQNYERRLKPKVLVVVDVQGEAMDKLVLRDLYECDKRHHASLHSGKNEMQKLDILEDIEPYKYPIKVSKMREYYLAINTKKSFFSIFK
jgi:hypothetical protein